MLKAHFQRLSSYNTWANKRVYSLLEQPAAAEKKAAFALFSHILAAESIWLQRLRYLPVTESPQAVYTLDACAGRIATLDAMWQELLLAATEDELGARTLTYKNLAGQQFVSPVREVITHVFNHGTYHRGQVVELLKGAVKPLPVTDFIAFSREVPA